MNPENVTCIYKILALIYKNKGDIQTCTDYKEIELISHNKSTTKAIFLLQQVIENITRNKETICNFHRYGEGSWHGPYGVDLMDHE